MGSAVVCEAFVTVRVVGRVADLGNENAEGGLDDVLRQVAHEDWHGALHALRRDVVWRAIDMHEALCRSAMTKGAHDNEVFTLRVVPQMHGTF